MASELDEEASRLRQATGSELRAKVPEAEQEACRKLWADVEALLKKTQKSK